MCERKATVPADPAKHFGWALPAALHLSEYERHSSRQVESTPTEYIKDRFHF